MAILFSGRRPLELYRHHHQIRTFVDARVPWVRDRALDHAVEKEKHLLPFLLLKDHLLTSSSPSVPLSLISPLRPALRLPFRPIRFIRLFPSAFVEESSKESVSPSIRPSPSLLRLHDDEQRLHSSTSCRSDAADRLLRLLMLSPSRRLPLQLLHRLRLDLGLPPDFPRSLFPDFPDYFQLVPSSASKSADLDLEVVCYRKDLAVSEMEKYAAKTGGYKKGTPLSFPLHFSRGFDLEKKVRNWVEDWQKLPYVSPYEDGSNLPGKSDIFEKWVVGVLHEILHLLVPKKTEKENLMQLARHVGLPMGVWKVIQHHPGIFYVSNKLKTQTVVLREAYRRDLLVETHPLMGLRYQYIHLMRKGKEGSVGSKGRKKGKKGAQRSVAGYNDGDEENGEDEDGDEEDDEEEDDGEFEVESDVDIEDEDEDEESDDDNDVDYHANQDSRRAGSQGIRIENTMPRRPFSPDERSVERLLKTRRRDMPGKRNGGRRSSGRGNFSRDDQRVSNRRRIST